MSIVSFILGVLVGMGAGAYLYYKFGVTLATDLSKLKAKL
jgi:hypothetical protein